MVCNINRCFWQLHKRDKRNYWIGLVHLVRYFANTVADAIEQPQDTCTRQRRSTRGPRQVTFNLKKVHKRWIALKIRMFRNTVHEPEVHIWRTNYVHNICVAFTRSTARILPIWQPTQSNLSGHKYCLLFLLYYLHCTQVCSVRLKLKLLIDWLIDCLRKQTATFKLNDHMACWFNFVLSRSSLKVQLSSNLLSRPGLASFCHWVEEPGFSMEKVLAKIVFFPAKTSFFH